MPTSALPRATSGDGASTSSHAYQAVGGSPTLSTAANGDVPLKLDPDEQLETPEVRHQRWLLGVSYMLAMGVCGIVLVAIGSNLQVLADNCHTTATHIGSVFIARGIGAVVGAVASAKLYRVASGNRIMFVTLLMLTGLIMVLPVVRDIYTMHVIFGLFGTCTAITDTGCQIQTRKVHGVKAGPWLGVNTVTFSISGAFVPLIGLLTGNLFAQCGILAGVTLISAFLVIYPTKPESLPLPPTNLKNRFKKKGAAASTAWDVEAAAAEEAEKKKCGNCPYVVEFLASWEALWLIGGKVAATSYFTSYVVATGVIEASHGSLLIVMLWVGISLGRVVGIFDQLNLPTDRLYRNVYVQLWCGAAGMALVLARPGSAAALWVGVLTYGFFNGPTIGYVYDLCNRTTAASEKGMSVIMFGLNMGASIIPYLVSWSWEHGGGPYVLPLVIMLSHLLPIPCQYLIRRFTASGPAIVTWNKAVTIMTQMSDPFAEPSKYDLTALGYSQAARDSETRSLLATAHGAEDEDDDPKDEVTKEF